MKTTEDLHSLALSLYEKMENSTLTPVYTGNQRTRTYTFTAIPTIKINSMPAQQRLTFTEP